MSDEPGGKASAVVAGCGTSEPPCQGKGGLEAIAQAPAPGQTALQAPPQALVGQQSSAP